MSSIPTDKAATQSQMVAAGVAAALVDREARKAWAQLIARSVAKGVFFGGIALVLLAFGLGFVLMAVLQAQK